MDRLQDFISCNEYSNNVCLVCLEAIAPGAAVWTCRNSCFCMLHLVCAQGWANQQLKTAAAKAASQAANPDLYASGLQHALHSLTSEKACHSFAEPHYWLHKYPDVLLDLQLNVHSHSSEPLPISIGSCMSILFLYAGEGTA